MRYHFLVSIFALGTACSSNEPEATPPPGTDAATTDAATTEAATTDAATDDAPTSEGSTDAKPACVRTARPENAARKVVVSHPYDAAAKKVGTMEVLDLAADGTLTRPMKTFSLATAAWERIVFTPDGEIGLVPEDDGTIGVFRIDASGAATVVHAAFKGEFYAQDLVMSHDGSRVLVVDGNTLENGGGLYGIDVGCDGKLGTVTKLTAQKTWGTLAFFHGRNDRAVVSGGPATGFPLTADSHLLEWGTTPKVLASGSAFGDSDSIPSWVDVSWDDKFAFVADNGIVVGNRLSVLTLTAGSISRAQTITIDNPAVVLSSPWSNAALVLSSDGTDAYWALKPQADMAAPWVVTGKVTYVHGKPELPSVAVMIERGTLKGRVLVAENVAVRQLQFGSDGSITDVAKLTYGSGLDNIVGSIGVQP